MATRFLDVGDRWWSDIRTAGFSPVELLVPIGKEPVRK